jgi:peptidoglycan/LPS O-acetylase OafA/YrhL
MKTENNIDFARLFASILVLISHGYSLSNREEPLYVFSQILSLGGLAVYIFFILSGYLIARSWVSDPNVWRFFVRRALRLLPALYGFLLVADLLIGPAFTTLPLPEFFSHDNLVRFVKEFDVSDLQGTLPGTFATNPLAGAFNGSLWTIQYEVACYLSLLVLGIVGALRSRWLAAGLAVILFAAYVYGTSSSFAGHFLYIDAVQAFDLAAMFFYAAAIYKWRDQSWVRSNLWIVLTVAACVFMKGFALLVALHVVLPPAVLALTLRETRYISGVGRFGDYSYGLYIYSFPAQQIVMYFLAGRISLIVFDMISFAGAFACAFVSWHLVEKKALGWKPKRRIGTVQESLTAFEPHAAG